MTGFRAAWGRLCRGGRNPCRRRRRLWQASPETGDGGRGAKRAGGRTQAAGRKQPDRARRSRGRIEVVSEKIKKRLFIKAYGRSEERRVGKECGSKCRSQGTPENKTKKQKKEQ